MDTCLWIVLKFHFLYYHVHDTTGLSLELCTQIEKVVPTMFGNMSFLCCTPGVVPLPMLQIFQNIELFLRHDVFSMKDIKSEENVLISRKF